MYFAHVLWEGDKCWETEREREGEKDSAEGSGERQTERGLETDKKQRKKGRTRSNMSDNQFMGLGKHSLDYRIRGYQPSVQHARVCGWASMYMPCPPCTCITRRPRYENARVRSVRLVLATV